MGDDYRGDVAVFRKSKKARQAEIDALRKQIDDLTTQIAALASSQSTTSTQLDELVGRLGSLDARITQVGSEVTHQLGELSGDIDALGRRTDSLDDGIKNLTELPALVDGVRTDQARLANEQARYEIAFRQDLAEIVDQIQRKRSIN
jgi:chromosome segregation ATPase